MLFSVQCMSRLYKGGFKKKVSDNKYGVVNENVLDLLYALKVFGLKTNVDTAIYDERSTKTYIIYGSAMTLTKCKITKELQNYYNIVSEIFSMCGFGKCMVKKSIYMTTSKELIVNVTKVRRSNSLHSHSIRVREYLLAIENKYNTAGMSPHFGLMFNSKVFDCIQMYSETIYIQTLNLTLDTLSQILQVKLNGIDIRGGYILEDLYDSYVSVSDMEEGYPTLVIDYMRLDDFPMIPSIEFMIGTSNICIRPMRFII